MNILRSIRSWVTRFKAPTKLPGIKLNNKENTLRVNIILIGDRLTGKSYLIWTLCHKTPWMNTEVKTPPTATEPNEIDLDTPYGIASLSLWDAYTYEDPRLRFLAYAVTGIMAFVFAIDNSDSLTSLEERWKEEIDHFCPGVPKVVIGCKSDVRGVTNGVCVDTQTGIDVAARLGARHYIECSARKYTGMEEFLSCVGTMGWEVYERSKSKQALPASFELSVTLPKENVPPEGEGGFRTQDHL
ncbi:hypothetical protein FRC07_003377 [Ceratobasidium sp. 392]|nr:hypothetical protein FRC07_003377 [Ceratobasidium sp. 392]